MPMNIDRERLMEENISLKNQLNKMHSETINHKREINNLENESKRKNDRRYFKRKSKWNIKLSFKTF